MNLTGHSQENLRVADTPEKACLPCKHVNSGAVRTLLSTQAEGRKQGKGQEYILDLDHYVSYSLEVEQNHRHGPVTETKGHSACQTQAESEK